MVVSSVDFLSLNLPLQFLFHISENTCSWYSSSRVPPSFYTKLPCFIWQVCQNPKRPMLCSNKRVENRVSKTTRNDQMSHFVENAEKRARCAFCHQPSAVHKCFKCNVHVHLKCFTAFHNSEWNEINPFDCLFKNIYSCIIKFFQ